MNKPKTAKEIKIHQEKYKEGSWRNYSILELGSWVHNLHKRSQHRVDVQKRRKDLEDARNYWLMMGSWLDDADKIDV